ncbi:MAG: hypothetical protein V5B38_05125 [Candidatus Accumulibacter propinquus]|jgi:hypothetical protein
MGLFRTALERGYKFVLIVDTPGPTVSVTQTTLGDREAAKMLRKFARMAEKRVRGE